MARNNTMTAPVLPIDMEADGYVIYPCFDCYPWHAEIVTDPETGATLVREWHAVGCKIFDDEESV